MLAPLVVLQLNVGWLAMARPNWSTPRAENCCLAPTTSETFPGVTSTLVGVWFTTTVTLLIAERPAVSVIVAATV
jgi:hypothetical protein